MKLKAKSNSPERVQRVKQVRLVYPDPDTSPIDSVAVPPIWATNQAL